MWEEEIPPVCWERGCRPSQDSKEVVFEGAMAAIDIWGHKLESAPISSDCIFVGCAGFSLSKMWTMGVRLAVESRAWMSW